MGMEDGKLKLNTHNRLLFVGDLTFYKPTMCSINFINKYLRMESMDLTHDGVEFLYSQLSHFPADQQRLWLTKVALALKNLQNHDGSRYALMDVNKAIQDLSNQNRPRQVLNVINAFDVPKFEYVAEKKKYMRVSTNQNGPQLHAEANSKAQLYKDRFALILKKTQRHKVFTTNYKLRTVEDLLAVSHKLDKVIVLGMLAQHRTNVFHLEDHSGTIELDISNAKCNPGLLTENSILLVEGCYDDGIIKVAAFGLPPVENAQISRSFMGPANFFGGPTANCVKNVESLAQVERNNPDATLALLSDIWLDDNEVIKKLDKLFKGFEDSPPIAFVFCGSFSSQNGSGQLKATKDGFQKLSKLLDKYAELMQQTQIIFVPSLQDLGVPTILPRPALPNWLIGDFQNKFPNCVFASNPCRIEYCTQEIVIFRQDLAEKLCRNCVKVPSSRKEISEQMAKTLTSQSHLCPLPLHVSPVYWEFDHALNIHPLPDLLVVADSYHHFHYYDSSQCLVTNPGSFSRSGGSFQVYLPAVQDKNEAIENSDVNTID